MSYRVRIIMYLAVYITMILILVCIADSVHSSGGSGFNDIHDGFIGSVVTNAHVCTAARGQCFFLSYIAQLCCTMSIESIYYVVIVASLRV